MELIFLTVVAVPLFFVTYQFDICIVSVMKILETEHKIFIIHSYYRNGVKQETAEWSYFPMQQNLFK